MSKGLCALYCSEYTQWDDKVLINFIITDVGNMTHEINSCNFSCGHFFHFLGSTFFDSIGAMVSSWQRYYIFKAPAVLGIIEQ